MSKEPSKYATEIVSRFYNGPGWSMQDGITEDARRWEDLREAARSYVSKCRLRVAEHIPVSGDKILDMASGPIQYEEYLEYSRNFRQRYCVDLSKEALRLAEERIGSHGVFLLGNFLELGLQDDFFDCSVSLHTIYHIDRDRQEEAVRKLLLVTKPGRPVVIVYSNPDSFRLLKRLGFPFRLARRVINKLRRTFRSPSHSSASAGRCHSSASAEPDLYFHAHPLVWWQRFRDVADVKVLPWRSFGSDQQKRFFPDNEIGRRMFDILFLLEDRFPHFFASHFQYPMVVLTKK